MAKKPPLPLIPSYSSLSGPSQCLTWGFEIPGNSMTTTSSIDLFRFGNPQHLHLLDIPNFPQVNQEETQTCG